MKTFVVKLLVLATIGCVVLNPGVSVSAASSSDFTQVITAGTLAVDILDASRNPVASPSIALTSRTFSFNCQTSTGTLGTNTQRLYAMNPNASTPNGWNVTIAATGGATASWSNSGATKQFDFNDANGSGCTDGADADSNGGQLSLDPSTSTLTADCTSCNNTGLTKGSSSAFVQGTTDNITLLTASNTASNPYRGYLTGIPVSQTIPAEQQTDNTYSLNLTLTITAL